MPVADMSTVRFLFQVWLGSSPVKISYCCCKVSPIPLRLVDIVTFVTRIIDYWRDYYFINFFRSISWYYLTNICWIRFSRQLCSSLLLHSISDELKIAQTISLSLLVLWMENINNLKGTVDQICFLLFLT